MKTDKELRLEELIKSKTKELQDLKDRKGNTNNKKDLLEQAQEHARRVMEGLDSSVTCFHLVQWAKEKLITNGYIEIVEKHDWELKKGGKYFYTRNNSSIIMVSIGAKVNLKDTLFKIVGGHTDSPTIRLAPNAYIQDHTYEKLNIQVYGGGSWQTWFDRDLSIAGKIVVENPDTKKLEARIIRIKQPILSIPNLAIHLSRMGKEFKWNNEDNLKALISTTVFDSVNDNNTNNILYNENKEEELTTIEKKVGKKLADLFSKELEVPKENIMDYNLHFYDTQKAQLIGIQEEFLVSARLDNLGTSVTSTLAFVDATKDNSEDSSFSMLCLFDKEEVGSQAYQGAKSSYFKDLLKRLFKATQVTNEDVKVIEEDSFYKACAKSFFISSDMNHGLHPNYQSYDQKQHLIYPNKGIVIPIDPNGSTTGEAEGCSVAKLIAKRSNVPTQDKINKQDQGSGGSTIGPQIALTTGMRVIDVGCPQLAMHSIREHTTCLDIMYLSNFLKGFWTIYEECVGDLFTK